MGNLPKSIKMLMTLNEIEIQKFKEYINSPYFNKMPRIIKLFDCIEELYINKKFTYDAIAIVKKNYGIYSASKVRKYKYDLGKLKEHFENFIAVQKLVGNELEKKFGRLEDYLFRSEGEMFNMEYQNVLHAIDNLTNDTSHYNRKVKVERLKANYELIYKDKREGDVNYQIISDNIDKDFLTKKLIYSVLMYNRGDIASVDYNFGLKEMAVKYLKEEATIDEPIIKCLFAAYKIVTNDKPKKNYHKLKALLNKYQNKISEDVRNILYNKLQNNLAKIFKKRKKLYTEFFNVYSPLLEQGCMRVNGNISAQMIKNMVTACIALDKYSYLEKFLISNRNRIYPEVLQEDVFNFNFSKMLLYKGEIEKASEMIVNIQMKDLYYKLAFRRLEIMLCYEMDQGDRMEHLVGAFKVALTPQRAKHISESRILKERNFINLFTEIYRMASNPDSCKKDVEKHIEKIKNAIVVSDQKWLKMKAKALLKKIKT